VVVPIGVILQQIKIIMRKDIGILFDLDGVIIDSEGIYTDIWNDIESIYPTGVENFAHVIKGSNLSKILNTYYPDKTAQEKVVELLMEYQDKMRYDIFPGVIEFLEDLKRHDIPSCIVTSSDNKKMKHLVDQQPGLLPYFNDVVTGDMVKNSKPDPECFLIGAEKLGVDIKSCFVFEDSISGIIAGKESGAKVIALATTLSRDEIRIKTDETIDNFIGYSVEEMLKV